MVGCDGHRLSFVDGELFKTLPPLKKGIIIPRRGITEFRKMLDHCDSSIFVSIEKGHFFSKVNNTNLFVRLIDAEFPDYRQVIPKETPSRVEIDLSVFTSALKRVSLLAHEKSKAVKFLIHPNLMTILSSNPDMGDAYEEIDIQYSGVPIEIGFNAKYILDCLSVFGGKKLFFLLKDKQSPGILQVEGEMNHTYVTMPMRI
jgi:DNA polymerase-3 subunit beta